MAEENKARQELLDFLDRKAFDPVLNASPDKFSGEDQQKLNKLQSTTRSTQKRYHENYTSAGEVVVNFKRDLNSEAAQEVHQDLKDLGLPTLNDFKDEFEKKAKDLGVS